jgi:hypothetical protein
MEDGGMEGWRDGGKEGLTETDRWRTEDKKANLFHYKLTV